MHLLGLAALLLAPQAIDWEAKALQLEFEGQYDQAVLARIEAIRTAESTAVRNAAFSAEAELHRRELTRQLQWYEGLVSTVRVPYIDSSIAGGRVAVLDERGLHVFDTDSGRRLFEPISVEDASQVTLSANGLRAVVWAYDRGTLHVIDLESARFVLREPIDYYSSHAISPDGQTLAVYTFDGDHPGVTCIRLESGERIRFPIEGCEDCSFDRFEFSPDGKALICVWGDFVIFDVEGGTAARVHAALDEEDEDAREVPYLRKWIDGGLRIAEVDSVRGLCIWNCADGNWEIEGLFAGDYPRDLAFDPVTREATVTGGGHVYRISIETGEYRGQPLVLDDAVSFGELSREYTDPVLSEDGRLVAAAGEQPRLRIWDTSSGRKLAREHRHAPSRYWDPRMQFIAPRRLAVGLPGQMIRIWDAGDHLMERVEIPSDAIAIASSRGVTERCAVARRLARAFVHSSESPPREIALPDGEYSGLSIDGDGEHAYFSGNSFGVWCVSLTDPRKPARLVSQIGGHGGVRVNAAGNYLLVEDSVKADVFDASSGRMAGRYGSVYDWPNALDDEGNLHVFVGGEWHLFDGDAAAKVQVSSFEYEIEKRGSEPITLTPFSGTGTLTIGPGKDEWESKATWTPKSGHPVEFIVSQENGTGALLRRFVEGPPCSGYIEFDEDAKVLRIHELSTGAEWPIPCPGGMPEHVVAQGDRLVVATADEATLYRISDRATVLQTPLKFGAKRIELIPGRDAFVVLGFGSCIDGYNVLTGERVSPRWWSDGGLPRLIWDDGESVIMEAGDGQILEYRYKDGSVRPAAEGHGPGLDQINLSGDGSLLAFSTESGEFVLYKRSTQETLFEGLPRDLLGLPLGNGLVPAIDWIHIDEDANVAVVLGRDVRQGKEESQSVRKYVALFDTRNGDPIRCFERATRNHGEVIWTDDLSRLAVIGYKAIEVFDVEKGTRTHYIPPPHSIDLASFDPTGKLLALCCGADRRDDDLNALPGRVSILHLGHRRFRPLAPPGHMRAYGPRMTKGAWAIEYPQDNGSVHELDLATGKIDQTAGQRPFRNEPDGSTLFAGWHTRVTVQGEITVPGPTRRGSRRSSGARFYGVKSDCFLNGDKTLALASAASNSDGLKFEVIDFRPSHLPPTEGPIETIAKDWSRRLALKIQDGEIIPNN